LDQRNTICPWSDVEAPGLPETEENWPRIVQQGEDPQRAVAGDQVKIGHASTEQRVPFPKIIVNVQP
jgi:hypothetical protein